MTLRAARRSRWALVVAVAGLGCGGNRDSPGRADPVSAGGSDAGARGVPAPFGPRANAPWLLHLDAAGLAARFAELRDARSIRCLVTRDAFRVAEALAIDAPPIAVRIAGFAEVEVRRRDGASPTIATLAGVVHRLADADDVDGLRLAFAEADRLGVPARWLDHDVAYRARVGAPLAADDRRYVKLDVARETALAGDIAAARHILDTELTRDDVTGSWTLAPHVGALVAVGRVDAARALIATAPAEDRLALAAAWLDVTLRSDVGIADAVAAVIAEQAAHDSARGSTWTPWTTLRAARRAGHAADLLPLRRAMIAPWPLLDREEIGLGLIHMVYEEVIATGDPVDRAILDPLIYPAWRADAATMYDAPLDVALAGADKDDVGGLTRLWVRHVAEGATPAMEARLAAAACPPADPTAGLPGVPPTAGVALKLIESSPHALAACNGTRVKVALISHGADAPLAEETLDGACSGACTPAEKRAGERTLHEIRARIDRGESTESELDYNFTDCLFAGARAAGIEHVGGRDLALIVDHGIGPHSVERDRYRLALEVCGELVIGPVFADAYARGWTVDQLSVTASADGRVISVEAGRDDWRGVVFRTTLPATCPGTPVDEVMDPGG